MRTDEEAYDMAYEHYQANSENLNAIVNAFKDSGEDLLQVSLYIGQDISEVTKELPESLQQSVNAYLLNSGLFENDYVLINFYNVEHFKEHIDVTVNSAALEIFPNTSNGIVGQILIQRNYSDTRQSCDFHIGYYEYLENELDAMDEHWDIYGEIDGYDGI